MKFLSLGSHTAPYLTEVQVAHALRDWGHEVVIAPESDRLWQSFPRIIDRVAPDVMIWTHNSSSAPGSKDAQRMGLELLAERGIVSAAYHLDRFWDLKRASSIVEEPMFSVDICMTADGGNDERFKDAGVNHRWVAPGVHGPDTLLTGRPQARYRRRVAFIGSWQHYHKEWPWRMKMLDALRDHYGADFGCFPAHPRKRLWGQALADFYASVEVVVGDSCFAGDKRGAKYWTDRPYETIGRGGFLLFPRVDGLEGHLVEGEHIDYFEAGDVGGMIAQIDRYLAAPQQRARIVKAGRSAIIANHTYRNRAREMLNAIVETEPTLMGWEAEARPDTYDAVAIRETWFDDCYRAAGHIKPGDVVVDLGANVGAFSIWAAKQGACVVAVEPVPANVSQLRRNAEKMGVADLITVINTGVSDYEGILRMGHFDYDRSQSWARRDEDGEIEVPVTTLDKLLPAGRVAMLKVDIEGSEVAALRGVDLSRVQRVSVETHHLAPGTTHHDVMDILRLAGFATSELGGWTEGYGFGVRSGR